MPIEPKIHKKASLETKKCTQCGTLLSMDDFARTHSIFYADGVLPNCNSCATDYLKQNDFSWKAIDKLCQWADIPFIVREWVRLKELNSDDQIWAVYSKVFADSVYQDFGWDSYDKEYRKLKEVGLIEEEIPEVREKKYRELRTKWGSNYDDEELNYLESLYKGLLVSQNVNGALQIDQAQKICKLSLEIDSRIRAGDKDVDKFLSSYDKLVKAADFTPKNTKDAVDFDSFAEVAFWLEKRGKQNKFYDNTTRDVIDETLKNIQSYNQRLYVNEGGIGNAITKRLESLNETKKEEENFYETQTEFNLDEYDNAGYTFEENDEFDIELEGV